MTLLFLNYEEIEEFTELMGYSMFDDDGIDVTLKFGYVVIDLNKVWFIDREVLRLIRKKLRR
ncbi:hypothetical protein D3C72_2031470 [compost metagenome]